MDELLFFTRTPPELPLLRLPELELDLRRIVVPLRFEPDRLLTRVVAFVEAASLSEPLPLRDTTVGLLVPFSFETRVPVRVEETLVPS